MCGTAEGLGGAEKAARERDAEGMNPDSTAQAWARYEPMRDERRREEMLQNLPLVSSLGTIVRDYNLPVLECDRQTANNTNNRARMYNARGQLITRRHLGDRWMEQGACRCHWCGKQIKRGWGRSSLDHQWPLRKGGLHTYYNIVWVCDWCQKAKGWATPEEWATNMGFRTVWDMLDFPRTHGVRAFRRRHRMMQAALKETKKREPKTKLLVAKNARDKRAADRKDDPTFKPRGPRAPRPFAPRPGSKRKGGRPRKTK